MKNFVHFAPTYLIIFAGSLLLYYFLLKISKSSHNIFKKYLYAASGKSVSNAILLGGLPLATAIIASSIFITFSSHLHLDAYQKNIILSMAGSSIFIIIYGYLDDRFELRPIVKLVMQFMAVTCFSLLTSQYLSKEYSNISLFFQFFVGMALVNGTNLLDGLDTLTIKLSLAGLAGFTLLGALYFVPIIPVLSIAFIMPLLAFYIYNKEPAKIHLGEIGSSFIGFIYFSLSTLFFATLTHSTSLPNNEMFFITTLPNILPITELTVSFFRRIYNRKSPFSGDRFHVHQILRNFHNIGPSNVANIMGGVYFLTMFFSIVSTEYYRLHPAISFVFLQSVLLSSYLSIGWKYWHGPDSLNLDAKSIFQSLRKKDVTFIETSQVNDFEFHLMVNEEDHEDENTESSNQESVNIEKSKAS